MTIKLMAVVAFVAICSAIQAQPYEVVFRSPRAVVSEEAPEVPQTPQVPQAVLIPSVSENKELKPPQQESKPDETDLKTDSSLWWRSYYQLYPAVYSTRYFARPSYISSPSYSYWRSYW